MDDRYYRKKNKHPRNLKRFLISRNLVKFAIVSVILLYVLFGNRGIIQRINLEITKKQMEEKVRTAEEESIKLRQQLERITTDDEFIEKIARERYGMIRSGETVYRITEE